MPTFLDVNGVAKQYDHSAAAANRWTRVSDGAVTTAITAADRVVLNDKTPYPKFLEVCRSHSVTSNWISHLICNIL